LHPTPEIPLAKPVLMAAGASAPLSIVGTFSDKTTFVSATDGVELANPVVAANSFKATVSAAAALPPSWGRVYAFSPVSAAEAWTPAVFVGSPMTFTLTATNGWTIKLVPEAKAFTIEKPGTATVTYKAEYFKPGATTAFETASGSLTIHAESTVGSYSFMMSPGNSGSAVLDVTQDRMMKEMEAQIKDPTAAQKKQDDFGCGTINLSIRSGAITGNVNCGRNVGSSLSFTGK
ncbi:MAG: hypothetical protein NTY02_19175, partial [Acidobacteria bacterium]|nr:hypothetical protein [Acidobacteriota bacterium]